MSDSVRVVLVDSGSPIALSDTETRFIYNLLPVGKFYDKRYGVVDVSAEKILRMSENFGKYPSYEVPVKLGHDDGAKSPGKVIGVEAKSSGLEITMLVDEDTAKAINEEQYRYMSAEYDENYHDKVTGKAVGAVLLGAALVNQPANPYMEPLKLVDDIVPEGGNATMNEVEELRLELSDLKAKTKAASEQSEIDAKRIADLEAQNKALMEERERAEAAANEAEVKSFCDKWSAQGIPPVMLEKVKPLLLSRTSRTIKLSDNAQDDVPSLKFFGELFESMPKVPMKQISTGEAPSVELSDTQKAVERGKAIAGSLK